MSEAQLRFTTIYLIGLIMDWELGLPLGSMMQWALSQEAHQ